MLLEARTAVASGAGAQHGFDRKSKSTHRVYRRVICNGGLATDVTGKASTHRVYRPIFEGCCSSSSARSATKAACPLPGGALARSLSYSSRSDT